MPKCFGSGSISPGLIWNTYSGENATPEVELAYIEEVRKRSYAEVIEVPAPVNEENFSNYGASTTPTLVLVDRAGIVRMYHPGQMSYEDLRARVESILK